MISRQCQKDGCTGHGRHAEANMPLILELKVYSANPDWARQPAKPIYGAIVRFSQLTRTNCEKIDSLHFPGEFLRLALEQHESACVCVKKLGPLAKEANKTAIETVLRI